MEQENRERNVKLLHSPSGDERSISGRDADRRPVSTSPRGGEGHGPTSWVQAEAATSHDSVSRQEALHESSSDTSGMPLQDSQAPNVVQHDAEIYIHKLEEERAALSKQHQSLRAAHKEGARNKAQIRAVKEKKSRAQQGIDALKLKIIALRDDGDLHAELPTFDFQAVFQKYSQAS
ncbi:hypothetical protein WJX73_009585 [Symbiochloris irregularis]|uniref:Uncharacterized protein n=1 Tax=Symbiochloris irregularis TaxID=706552 RepID=A0AAW1NQT2_9CHLO